VDNYDKFVSDCLTGIVWEDDSQVVEKISRKVYGEVEKVIIKVEAICH
jgi:Holliday junction resolvase RusA-like endonuclease